MIYEVSSVDREGSVKELYFLRCTDLEEAQANVGDRHGDDAVIIRPCSPEPQFGHALPQ